MTALERDLWFAAVAKAGFLVMIGKHDEWDFAFFIFWMKDIKDSWKTTGGAK